jgi:hypothetical protein
MSEIAATFHGRIVVALDAGQSSSEILAAAAETASRLGLPLVAVFVEDADIFKLRELDCALHIDFLGGADRPGSDDIHLEALLHVTALRLRERLSVLAARLGVTWSFSVARGEMGPVMQGAAQRGDILVVPGGATRLRAIVTRLTRSAWLMPPHPNLNRPTVVVTGATPAQRQAVKFALRLARAGFGPVDVIAITTDERDVQAMIDALAGAGTPDIRYSSALPSRSAEALLRALAGPSGAPVILAAEVIDQISLDVFELLDRLGRPVLLLRD